jgi:hypothetical protein
MVSFLSYIKECGKRDEPAFTSFQEVMQEGVYGTCAALYFWREVTKKIGSYLNLLLPVASMLLACPAGESHDECVFSDSSPKTVIV